THTHTHRHAHRHAHTHLLTHTSVQIRTMAPSKAIYKSLLWTGIEPRFTTFPQLGGGEPQFSRAVYQKASIVQKHKLCDKKLPNMLPPLSLADSRPTTQSQKPVG